MAVVVVEVAPERFVTPPATARLVDARTVTPGAGKVGRLAIGVLFCGDGAATAAAGAAGLVVVVAALAGFTVGAFVTRVGTARAGALFVAGAAG